ncbi:MAG: prepilin peptidase [Oscillospiraceae bacterium]|nr:prepilin peptidase [Oscillospiraceae bacterium]
MIIRPIYPTLPIRPPQISAEMAMLIFNALSFLLLAGAAAFFIGVYAAKRWKADKTKTAVAFVSITVAVTILLLCFFGFAVSTVKGIILCLILLFSSYSDIKTREADDYLHVMILLTAFNGREPTEIPGMLLSAILITLPLIMPVILCKGKVIGGADVKLSIACTFLLGISRGIIGLMAGLTIGVLANLIIQTRKNKAEGFPLIPYLAAGFMAAYFI